MSGGIGKPSKDASPIEEKQWIVSRSDVLHRTVFDELQLSREDLERIRQDEISDLKSKLNTFLSVCTVVLTILVGLYASDLSHTKLLDTSSGLSITYGSLFWTLLLGVAMLATSVFTVVNYVIRKTTIVFNRLENSMVHGQENLNHNYGYLIKNTIWLTNVTIDTLKNYSDFMPILAAIVFIPISEALNESAKFKLLNPYYKTLFTENARVYAKTIDQAISSFSNLNTQQLPQDLLKQVAKDVSSYQNKFKNKK